jgi:hypothetical protein
MKTLTGKASTHIEPQLSELYLEEEKCVEYVSTEITTNNITNLVTFIDSPGLVDGGMEYPFDVNKAILWFGNISDLIFVFFDPIGQALCKRTLDIVEQLNEDHGNKMHFFLSKADEAGNSNERQVFEFMNIFSSILLNSVEISTNFKVNSTYF